MSSCKEIYIEWKLLNSMSSYGMLYSGSYLCILLCVSHGDILGYLFLHDANGRCAQ